MYGAWLCEPWPLVGCCDFNDLAISPAITGVAYRAASEKLWLATGQRFGNCAVTFRPCRSDCTSTLPVDPWWGAGSVQPTWGGATWPTPALIGGEWFNIACGSCLGDCGCTSTSEVVFPDPVTITSVEVDGVTLTEGADWVLYNGQRLVRLGGAEWPLCQNWTVADGPGTWKVVAAVGSEVPELGKMAVAKLTCELAKSCAGFKCDLPPGATQVTRAGVSITLPNDYIAKGQTGITIVDMFIQSVNPKGLQDRARAYSPDVIPPRFGP